MNRFKLVLFDLDGVLRNNREPMLWAYERVFEDLHISQPDPQQLLPHIHSVEAVRVNFAPDQPYEYFLKLYDRHIGERQAEIGPYSDVSSVLSQLKAVQLLLGMVSSSRQAKKWLKDSGLSQFFEVVIDAKDSDKRKPDPEPVLLALERLNILANEAIMIGDLPVDIEAAERAGLYATIGITHGFGSREMLEQAGANHIVESLAVIPELIKQIDHQ